LLFAENVSIELAESLGKSAAHEILTSASKKSRQTGQHLRAVLEEDSTLQKLLHPGDLDRLFSPELGSELANEMIDRVLAGAHLRHEHFNTDS
jgi:3-carboxy-cis,cis-muconate cycloisomerase